MKRLLSVILALVFAVSAFAQEQEYSRPKVGLVLSGGGAKGAAHVGVIKVLEEAGIPIDIVVGTSMGSIIGGLYAYGYSTNQLDSLLRSQDWMSLLLNSTERSQKDFLIREYEERYIVTVPVFRDKSKHLYGGVLSGEAVLDLFYALTPEHADSMDFNNLEIPFACVAYDVLKNKELVLNKGILSECIRASMSIPAVFSPVRKDGMVLVDGGMANNYPADVAKQMGADIIIGVTLNAEGEEKTAAHINSTSDVIMQLLDNATDNKIEDNVSITDLLINVDTKGYSAASFSNEAIGVLIARGEQYARLALDDIYELKEAINPSAADSVSKFPITVPRETAQIAGAAKPEEQGCNLSGGFRVDNEELASLLLGGSYKWATKCKPALRAEIRLGRRLYARGTATIKPFASVRTKSGGNNPMDNLTLEATYKFDKNETKLYHNGERVIDRDYHEQFARLSLYKTWNYLKVTAAIDYNFRRFDHLLSTSLVSGYYNGVSTSSYDREENINYYCSSRFDNRDTHVYPHTGTYWIVRYTYKTDNGKTYEGENGLSVLELIFEHNFPLGDRLTFTPSVWGRFISTPEYYRLGDRNFIGGVGTWAHYVPQQVPFVGVNYFEAIDDKFGAVGATFRYRIGKKHYLSAIGNYGRASTYVEDFFNEEELLGFGLGYGYKTPVGPLDFNLNWSNKTSKVGYWLSFGYMF